ncbi:MAG: hypothetical protein NVS1B10_01440 [Candidatus Saccharimonadales bacterium]
MLEGLTKQFVDNYAKTLQLDRTNDMTDWTDVSGIKHIYINSPEKEYELINGVWVEKAPF